MKRFILVAAMAAALSGCLTPEEQMAADDGKCRNFGAVPGSPEYLQCRMFVEQERNRKEQSEREARAIENAARTLAPRPRPVFQQPPQRMQVCQVTPTGMSCRTP
jgi:hypothetical protein